MKSTNNKTAEAATDPAVFLPRDRLIDQILASNHTITWIGAPKGMGKTVLLTQLNQALRQHFTPREVVLVELSPDQGFDHIQKHLQPRLQTTLSTNRLKRQPLHLLIDGLDSRQHTSLLQYLIDIAQTLPKHLRLYLGVDESVPLQRLEYLTDTHQKPVQLQRICQSDLSMTSEETRSLLELHSIPANTQRVTGLTDKSDGIPALQTLLIEEADQPSSVQCQLIGKWIEHELLPHLEPMEFLRLSSLSILSRFNLEQASQLIGVPLEQTRSWLLSYRPLFFRYTDGPAPFVWSPLGRPFFFQCLLHRYRDLLPRILKRSEPWLTDSHINAQCIDYLLQCVAKPWSQDILISKFRGWHEQRNASAIIETMEKIPAAQRRSLPQLVLYYSWALMLQRRTDEADHWLQHLDNIEPLYNDVVVLRGLVRACCGTPRPTYQERTRLLEDCLDVKSLFHDDALSHYINLLHVTGAAGASKQALQKAISYHQANSNLIHLSHTKTLLWRFEFNEGHTTHAIEEARRHLAQLQKSSQSRNQAIAITQSGLADFLYETNQLEQAKSLYLQAIPVLIQSDWVYESVLAQVGLIRLYISEGQHQQALEEIQHIKSRVRHRENTSLDAVLCFETMRILKARGQSVLPAATEYQLDTDNLSIESLFKHQHDKERLFWIKCYILILLEQRNFTSALIYSVKGLIKSLNLNDNRYRTLFYNIKALCEYKLGQQQEAFNSLNEAMRLAQQHQFIRSVISDDYGWKELWRQADKQRAFSTVIVPSFISELRDHLNSAPNSLKTIEGESARQESVMQQAHHRILGLTDKEYEILKLLAEGLCNKNIAKRSEIALTTVKWHLQNIFGKLDARNRTEAVVKAQEHALIGNTEA